MIIEAIENRQYEDIIKNECCLCGITKAYKFKDRKEILSKSFTDYNLMRAKNSKSICGYCEKLVKDDYMESPKGKTCGIRLYSFLIENNKFEIIEKKDKEKYLFDYEFNIPYVICFTNTGQKHISWKSIIGKANNIIPINTESGTIYLERKKYKDIYIIIKNLYANKVSKEELRQCNIIPKNMSKMIENKKSSFSEIINIKKYKNDTIYEFLVECLYKIKEEQ